MAHDVATDVGCWLKRSRIVVVGAVGYFILMIRIVVVCPRDSGAVLSALLVEILTVSASHYARRGVTGYRGRRTLDGWKSGPGPAVEPHWRSGRGRISRRGARSGR